MSTFIFMAIVIFSANISITTGQLPTRDFIELLLKGVSINASGTVIKIGVVTVPFDTLCKISVSQPDACRICMLDCQSVHKAVSGKCGRHPNRPDELTCLCDYSQATTLPSVSSVCRSYSLNFLKTDFLDEFTDALVTMVLHERFERLLCSSTLMGCKSDCINNHGAKTGVCTGGYCLCKY